MIRSKYYLPSKYDTGVKIQFSEGCPLKLWSSLNTLKI